jgi:microfibrillar-associated protein 1
MSVAAGVSDAAITVREKLRGKIGQTKVKRYWPGKAPEWADDVDEEIEARERTKEELLHRAFPPEASDGIGVTSHGVSFGTPSDDPRLRRLAESRRDREEAIARHREIRQAEIVSTREEERKAKEGAEFEEEDEDAIEERRRRLREKRLNEPEVEELQEEEEEEEEEEESEYETDSEEDVGVRVMIKPVFVPKQERETIQEREKLEAEEIALEEAVKKRREERKIETKQIVIEEIKKEEEIAKNMEANADNGEVDTDDEVNEAEEYEAWKVREIARIKRDRDDRDALIKEREEIEKVRNMTEEERREWEKKNPKPLPMSKKKWKFMQKYFHKGAFFQTPADDRVGTEGGYDIYKRDFSAPTGEDKLDKTILPKVMQVKHFGRSGRTKWTHLVAEDTTDWTDPYVFLYPYTCGFVTYGAYSCSDCDCLSLNLLMVLCQPR